MGTSMSRTGGGDRDQRVQRPAAGAIVMVALLLTACSGNTASSTPTHPSTAPSTAAVVATPPATPTAAPTRAAVPGGRIAFVWTNPGSDVNNIASVAADGSDLRLLTNSTTRMSEGVEWVPNTDRLLFDGDRGNGVRLYTMDGHGGDERPEGEYSGGYPSISSDGLTIAISAGEPGPSGIFLIGVDGKNPRRVTSAPAASAIDNLPAFSPDGKRIVFQRVLDGTEGHGRSAIFVVNTDGSALKQLTDMATNASYPNWSPDGTRIVFNDNSANGSLTVAQNVWVMNADGTNLVNLTHTTAGTNWAFAGDWSPDGTKIVYIAVSTVRALAVMNPDGSDSTDIWIAPDREGIDDPDWGPNP
jgi:Tol biopolymer transport system component